VLSKYPNLKLLSEKNIANIISTVFSTKCKIIRYSEKTGEFETTYHYNIYLDPIYYAKPELYSILYKFDIETNYTLKQYKDYILDIESVEITINE
jgi:hypothetical protein